jgi:hypothetical protein
MEQLLTEKDEGQPLYADSGYTGEDQEAVYKKEKVINKIIEKGYRNKPLTEEQITNNKEKSRTRVWLCRKQYAWLHCPYYRDCKSKSKNRDDEPHLQYLSLYSIKNSSCHGIGMSGRERLNFVST